MQHLRKTGAIRLNRMHPSPHHKIAMNIISSLLKIFFCKCTKMTYRFCTISIENATLITAQKPTAESWPRIGTVEPFFILVSINSQSEGAQVVQLYIRCAYSEIH